SASRPRSGARSSRRPDSSALGSAAAGAGAAAQRGEARRELRAHARRALVEVAAVELERVGCEVVELAGAGVVLDPQPAAGADRAVGGAVPVEGFEEKRAATLDGGVGGERL